MFHRQELEADLLAALSASRELPPEYEQQVAETVLDKLQDRGVFDAPHKHRRQRCAHDRLCGAELVSGALVGAVGLGGLAYISDEYQALIPVASPFPVPGLGTVKGQWVSALPSIEIAAVLIVAVVVATVLHAWRGSRSASRLLCAAVMMMSVWLGFMVMHSGQYLSLLIAAHYVDGWVLPALAALTVVLAVVDASASVVRSAANVSDHLHRGRR